MYKFQKELIERIKNNEKPIVIFQRKHGQHLYNKAVKAVRDILELHYPMPQFTPEQRVKRIDDLRERMMHELNSEQHEECRRRLNGHKNKLLDELEKNAGLR